MTRWPTKKQTLVPFNGASLKGKLKVNKNALPYTLSGTFFAMSKRVLRRLYRQLERGTVLLRRELSLRN